MERFRKLKTIGRGQHGEVYLVEREDASLAALKQIPLDDPLLQNQEVTLLSQLSHPHIIQYHESFKSEENLFIIIDYAEGGDLANRIKIAKSKSSKFSEQQIWKWFFQICQGLEYIHSHKIIHRDLKSQNIFLTKTGDVKIGDFGISKQLGTSGEFARSSIGTPYYIAPEVCKGEMYDYKADVWSLGCILYELCSLRRPFEGENIARVINNILHKQPEKLSEEYSEELARIIFEMLNKNPDLRPNVSKILSICLPKCRKSFTKEISIKIPIPTYASTKKESVAPFHTSQMTANLNLSTPLTNRSNNCFNFSESLLKQCPSSPIRPMLLSEFLKKRLGKEVFERVQRFVVNSKDPVKILREEPWIFLSLCGEDSLSVIDAAIACGAFGLEEKSAEFGWDRNKGQGRAFQGLVRHASQ